ncbi:MAG: hypothetical protein IJW60_00260 [Clostridia bacterium]|nr:hypothetical protein [Clostridia bacterium]
MDGFTKTNEFIRFKKDYIGKHGDFSGQESPFTVEDRLEFLRHYSDEQRKLNGLKKASKKAVLKKEVKASLQKIDYKVLPNVRKRVEFSSAQASLLKKNYVYEGWQFYTKRTTLENGAVAFNDGVTTPMPCAKYEFDGGEKLRELHLQVYIASDYKKERVALTEKDAPHAITSGRTIEVRGGKDELLKIQFYAIGVACARVGSTDVYHHKNVVLGNYRFDEWNDLKITLSEGVYAVELNGEKTEGLLYTIDCVPDTLFLSGGFHPRGAWKVKPTAFTFKGQKQTQFFVPAQKSGYEEEPLGKVKLPYVVGRYENKDKYLILRKTFRAKTGKKAALIFDSLDPGGSAYLNGELIMQTDDFRRQVIDVTDYIKDGENALTIVVEPRAPEILYPWHRCQDTYMGWFCNGVALEIYDERRITALEAVTKEIRGWQADVSLSVKTENAAGKTLKIYMRQTNPAQGEERLIYSGKAENEQTLALTLAVKAWSPENPALYALRAEIEGIDDYVIETGFRTITQKDGHVYLNNERIVFRGALLMQFLPPYENIVTSHVCPTDEELVWQFAMIKGMNGNLARLHMLGYGTNDERYARFCDRLGLTLIWITRYIDSVESVQWGDGWAQSDLYVQQMQEVKQHPSIIAWEGSNEYRAWGKDIDWIYDEFVSKVKKVDNTRLLFPCSHFYYGTGFYCKGFFYQEDGESDQDFQPAKASFGWRDDSVVRSVHAYYYTLGYGSKWNVLREQPWAGEQLLLDSKIHSYMVTEMAAIGRHDHTTPECKKYVKNDSYELGEERLTIGRLLDQSQWQISQAYQALAAAKAIQSLRIRGVDGMAWCCLTGGANDASYLKPPVDFYGYAKYAYYTMRESYAETAAYNANTDVLYGTKTLVKPCLVGGRAEERYDVRVCVFTEDGTFVDERVYENVQGAENAVFLGEWKPNLQDDGYYRISYEITTK